MILDCLDVAFPSFMPPHFSCANHPCSVPNKFSHFPNHVPIFCATRRADRTPCRFIRAGWFWCSALPSQAFQKGRGALADPGPLVVRELDVGAHHLGHARVAADLAALARYEISVILQRARARVRLTTLPSRPGLLNCIGVDRYQCRLCRVTYDGCDVGDQMVRDGHARIE